MDSYRQETLPRPLELIPGQLERFYTYFPDAHIEVIYNSALVPQTAMEFFEGHSKCLILPEDYHPRNFMAYFAISHANGDIAHAAQQTKIYSGSNNETEDLTYLYETRVGNKIGHGEIRMNYKNSRYFASKPFVGFTKTEDDFLRQGLGIRRLKVMNGLTQMLYGLPLNSDTLLTDSARQVWLKLIGYGIAKKYSEPYIGGEHERYAFVM